MLPSYYEFQNSVKILSGRKALENIPFELVRLGAQRPLLVTDKVLVKLGLVQPVIEALRQGGIERAALYDDVPPDSSVRIANEIARLYRTEQCDAVLAVGGGSVIDTAKGVNILIQENSDDLLTLMGMENLKSKRLHPFIVVPTTSGTGSEATLVAVIANPDKNIKMEFTSYYLLPDVAVLDPRMTESLPPRLTASTGMDTLCHAIEASTSIQKNPLSDAYAFAAIRLVREYLPQAVVNGRNQEARLAMANASLMAGAAFSNAMVGIVHAIGHACGGVCHVPHGDAMTILLPHGMEYNLDAVAAAYGELLLPLAGPEIYALTPQIERARQAIESIRRLNEQFNQTCGLPLRLRDVGVKEEDFERIARTAINDGAIVANPKDIGLADVLDILRAAY